MRDRDAPRRDRKEAVVIVNPAAHNLPSPKRLQEAADWLQAEGWEVEWQRTEAPGQATAMAAAAAARGVPIVFACGGDGTLNEVVNGLAGSETAMALIPAGTVNLWARELRMHKKKPLDAVRLAIGGDLRRVDLGRAGSRYFLCVASYGIDAAVTAGVAHPVKARFGAIAYALASFRVALRYRGTPVTIRVNGEELSGDTLMVIAGNARQYAGLTQIVPEAVVDDGLLDFCIFLGRGKAAVVRHALRALLRLHRLSRNVLYRRAERMTLSWQAPLPLQLDGDFVPESPAEITVARGALWAVTPAGKKTSIFSDQSGPQPKS
jgi:YegS/Rv2252/BmrU family lipid kinase